MIFRRNPNAAFLAPTGITGKQYVSKHENILHAGMNPSPCFQYAGNQRFQVMPSLMLYRNEKDISVMHCFSNAEMKCTLSMRCKLHAVAHASEEK